MYFSYPQETYSEIPDEISLAISISGCGLACKGCHSTETWDPEFGRELTTNELDKLFKKYKYSTAVLFYGGEWNLEELEYFIEYTKKYNKKVCLYTGLELEDFSDDFINKLDFIKVGKYNQQLGGLQSKKTNQKFFKIEQGELIDWTYKFQG